MTQKRNREAFLYILPCLVVLGFFVYYPLVMNLIYSFQSFGMSDTTRDFVGLANFKKLFSDENILTSLKNNVLYAVISVIIQVTYFKKTHGKRFFRMAPIHHHFELLGNSETRIVAVFTIVTALLSLLGLIGILV